jgi:hypothetical protein
MSFTTLMCSLLNEPYITLAPCPENHVFRACPPAREKEKKPKSEDKMVLSKSLRKHLTKAQKIGHLKTIREISETMIETGFSRWGHELTQEEINELKKGLDLIDKELSEIINSQ